MKKVVLLFAVVIAAVSLQAQDKKNLTLGVGVTVALPMGDLADGAGVGFGPKVQAEYMFTENVSGLASVGYNFFTEKDGVTFSTLPVQVGGRYHFTGGFFAGVELGYMNLHSKFTGGGSNSGGGFAFNPHVGYDLPKIQLALGYQSATDDGFTASYLGLSGIYKF
jgi:hypothetical protein